jgi:hypothetical protein
MTTTAAETLRHLGAGSEANADGFLHAARQNAVV